MRILLVFPFLPYPPDDGGRIGFFNPIKYLSREHEVLVVCLTEGRDRNEYVEELKKFCVDLRTLRRSKWQDPYRLLKGTLSVPPGSAAKYWYSTAGDLIRAMIARHKPDIAEFHHLNTAIYRPFAEGIPTVLREHNVEYKVWEKHAEHARSSVERWYAARCAPRVRAYEAKMAPRFARCLTVSSADARHLAEIAPTARVEAIPSGVDTEYFYPSPKVQEESFSMVLTGSFEWRPKQHNLWVLLTEIMPRIRAKVPEATLCVVGKGIPDELKRLAERTPGVTVTGTVPDVRPYVCRASLVLNYLESGGGIALKVLEAMAMRKPVLSNSLGCEGIEVEHGQDVFLADGLEKFAAAATYLLEDSAARRGLAEEGYQRVLKGYSWNVIAGRLEDCYKKVVEERQGFNRSTDAARVQYAD